MEAGGEVHRPAPSPRREGGRGQCSADSGGNGTMSNGPGRSPGMAWLAEEVDEEKGCCDGR